MHRTLAETIMSFSRGIERSKRPEDRKLAADYLAALAVAGPGHSGRGAASRPRRSRPSMKPARRATRKR